MDIVDYAITKCGKKEINGSNAGPEITAWKHEVMRGGYTAKPISWCGIFVTAMMLEFTKMDIPALKTKLGFVKGIWYPDATTSWLQEGLAAARMTNNPRRGDVFLWMKRNPDGSYSKTEPHHIGFVAESFQPVAGKVFSTVEGNTTSMGEGTASREGDGVYQKSRTYAPGAFVFLSMPSFSPAV